MLYFKMLFCIFYSIYNACAFDLIFWYKWVYAAGIYRQCWTKYTNQVHE